MNRKMIIMSDSTCDLSPDLISKHDIKIIPLYVNFGEESYQDGVTLTAPELFKKVSEKKTTPKTAAVSPGEFYQFVMPYIKQGYNIFYTGISSKLSATYQSAVMVKKEIEDSLSEKEERIFIVDSKNLSTGIGLLLLKACKFRSEGDDGATIKRKVEEIVPRVKTQFVIETLEYLHKGGRCKGITRFFGTVLRIKLKIVVRGGGMTVGAKTIGSMKKAVTAMMNIFFNDVNNNEVDSEFIFMTHAEAPDALRYMMGMVKDPKIANNIMETKAGCVISSHCGPGCIGILYILKDKEVDINEGIIEEE